MKIAILGWGSLIWNPQNLPREGTWHKDGPNLPLEFSRVSRDCRLTLVIDEENGVVVPTRYVLSPRMDINDAVHDLRVREETIKKWIGFVDLRRGKCSNVKFREQANVHKIVHDWCERSKFDGAVWTALPPSFSKETNSDYSVENAVTYLKGLPKTAKKIALKYIQNAPEEIRTPLRVELINLGMIEC